MLSILLNLKSRGNVLSHDHTITCFNDFEGFWNIQCSRSCIISLKSRTEPKVSPYHKKLNSLASFTNWSWSELLTEDITASIILTESKVFCYVLSDWFIWQKCQPIAHVNKPDVLCRTVTGDTSGTSFNLLHTCPSFNDLEKHDVLKHLMRRTVCPLPKRFSTRFPYKIID